MTWTTPLTFVDNTIPTASQLNASIRDNLNETSAAKATAAGRYMATSGVNAIVERAPVEASVGDTASRASTVYGHLTTGPNGPAVTTTNSARVLISITARGENLSTGFSAIASYRIDGGPGAGGVDPGDSKAIWLSEYLTRQSITDLYAISAGSHVWDMLYRATGGTAEFSYRHILVMPF